MIQRNFLKLPTDFKFEIRRLAFKIYAFLFIKD